MTQESCFQSPLEGQGWICGVGGGTLYSWTWLLELPSLSRGLHTATSNSCRWVNFILSGNLAPKPPTPVLPSACLGTVGDDWHWSCRHPLLGGGINVFCMLLKWNESLKKKKKIWNQSDRCGRSWPRDAWWSRRCVHMCFQPRLHSTPCS